LIQQNYYHSKDFYLNHQKQRLAKRRELAVEPVVVIVEAEVDSVVEAAEAVVVVVSEVDEAAVAEVVVASAAVEEAEVIYLLQD
jgi:ABC-type arginine transport system ATPase subunit